MKIDVQITPRAQLGMLQSRLNDISKALIGVKSHLDDILFEMEQAQSKKPKVETVKDKDKPFGLTIVGWSDSPQPALDENGDYVKAGPENWANGEKPDFLRDDWKPKKDKKADFQIGDKEVKRVSKDS